MTKMYELTPREKDVMDMACLGYYNKEIAHELGIDLTTVEKHRDALYHKLGVGSVVALIRVGLRHGLINIDDFMKSKIGENLPHNCASVMKNRKLREASYQFYQFTQQLATPVAPVPVGAGVGNGESCEGMHEGT